MASPTKTDVSLRPDENGGTEFVSRGPEGTTAVVANDGGFVRSFERTDPGTGAKVVTKQFSDGSTTQTRTWPDGRSSTSTTDAEGRIQLVQEAKGADGSQWRQTTESFPTGPTRLERTIQDTDETVRHIVREANGKTTVSSERRLELADGRVVSERTTPDGQRTSTTTFKDGSSERITHSPDGGVSGEKVAIEKDGTEVRQTIDTRGTVSTNRTNKSVDSDGTERTVYSDDKGNSTVVTNREYTKDDGSRVVERTVSDGSSTTEVHRQDGSSDVVNRYPDGTTEMRSLTKLADGTIVKEFTDRSGQAMTTRQTPQPDGSYVTRATHQDGRVSEYIARPDGSIESTTTYPDKHQETFKVGADGSGTKVVTASDGTVVPEKGTTFFPDDHRDLDAQSRGLMQRPSPPEQWKDADVLSNTSLKDPPMDDFGKLSSAEPVGPADEGSGALGAPGTAVAAVEDDSGLGGPDTDALADEGSGALGGPDTAVAALADDGTAALGGPDTDIAALAGDETASGGPDTDVAALPEGGDGLTSAGLAEQDALGTDPMAADPGVPQEQVPSEDPPSTEPAGADPLADEAADQALDAPLAEQAEA